MLGVDRAGGPQRMSADKNDRSSRPGTERSRGSVILTGKEAKQSEEQCEAIGCCIGRQKDTRGRGRTMACEVLRGTARTSRGMTWARAGG